MILPMMTDTPIIFCLFIKFYFLNYKAIHPFILH